MGEGGGGGRKFNNNHADAEKCLKFISSYPTGTAEYNALVTGEKYHCSN